MTLFSTRQDVGPPQGKADKEAKSGSKAESISSVPVAPTMQVAVAMAPVPMAVANQAAVAIMVMMGVTMPTSGVNELELATKRVDRSGRLRPKRRC